MTSLTSEQIMIQVFWSNALVGKILPDRITHSDMMLYAKLVRFTQFSTRIKGRVK
jgi:hypothetical protein